MNNKLLVALLATAAFVGVPLAMKFSKSGTTHEAELVKVETKEIHPLILATGNVVFRQEVQLSSEVIGRVTEILVAEGGRVEKGQVLLRLDPTSYRAEMAQQEANLRNTAVTIERARINIENERLNVDRYRRLVQDKYIEASKYDTALYQLKLAEIDLQVGMETRQQALALLAQVKERLAKTEVRAPISGVATQVQIKVGETAIPSTTGIAGSAMMTIADVGTLMAEVNVDEADVAKVTVGQRTRVYPAALEDGAVEGSVVSVALAPKVGTQGRSYTVKVRLDTDGARTELRTGMTCRVEIVTGGGGRRPVLPIQAVMRDEAKAKDSGKEAAYAYVVVDGVVHKRTVELGLADDANQEVVRGLAVGDVVASGPARLLRRLREGDSVMPAKAKSKDRPTELAMERQS